VKIHRDISVDVDETLTHLAIEFEQHITVTNESNPSLGTFLSHVFSKLVGRVGRSETGRSSAGDVSVILRGRSDEGVEDVAELG